MSNPNFDVSVLFFKNFRISRANQTFIFPILLYEEFLPSAVIYGTFVPVIVYSSMMKFIVNPHVEKTRQEEILKKRTQFREKLLEHRKEAEAVRQLLKQNFEKIVKQESEVKGLVIHKGLYGKNSMVQIAARSGQLPTSGEVIDVKLPLQCLVRDSQLIQPAASKVSCCSNFTLLNLVMQVNIPGFYDPCMGEDKVLYIKYSLRDNTYEVTIPDQEAIYLTVESSI